MEKEIPCLSNDMDSKEVISFYVLLKLINLLNVLRMMTSTWMGTSKLHFFSALFSAKPHTDDLECIGL